MTELPRAPVTSVGLIRLREHCTFTWQEPERGGARTAEVRAAHCAQCVEELRKMGYLLVQERPHSEG